jgi:hypothetical protein
MAWRSPSFSPVGCTTRGIAEIRKIDQGWSFQRERDEALGIRGESMPLDKEIKGRSVVPIPTAIRSPGV